ncbi:chondroadherin [Corythoichthys intestinalis]|uniref:chondroadherin n=1 Tax=Corythoichthys intestinalis TaxID=161448 RepID=UPI0025A5D632|nr:chondroadherin [Corythoichthys intestinalis]XP_061807302.1 chondroadherin-like [Nerophis lumbriciformis]
MRRVGCLLLLGSVLLAGGAPPGPCPSACRCHGDLQHVICEGAGLKKIPRVSASTRLLDLQRNPLGGVPGGAFADSGGLVSLHMQRCRLRRLAAGAFRGLTQLVYLYLSHNRIAGVHPEAFRDLGRLTYLHLDHNRIAELAKGVFSPLVNLFALLLDDNKLRRLRPGTFAGAGDLRRLHLSGNELSALDAGSLDDVENLAALRLDANRLASFPAAALAGLRVVEELSLAGNPLGSVPDRAFLSFGRYLETLWLDRAGLEKMSDEAFAGVTALTSLHLDDNKLRALPRSLDLSRVTNLTVANNPWTCSCQLAPLRRWMDAHGRRPTDALCASPPSQRGKRVRESAVFAACRAEPKPKKNKAAAARQ